MGDPLSIAASVTAVAATAIESTKYLLKTIEGIKDAPKTISDIDDDLKTLQISLQELIDTANDPHLKILESSAIEESLVLCSRACQSFAQLLTKWTKNTAGDKMKLWTRTKVYCREDKIAGYRAQLRDTKLTLIISLGTASILNKTKLDSMKPTKDMMLIQQEATILKEREKISSKMDFLELCLRHVQEASDDIDDESQPRIAELRGQQETKKILANMCDKAYTVTHFARTGIRVHGVQATEGGLALGGYINAPADLKMNHDINVSEISAHGADSTAMGGYMNIDFEKLRGKSKG